MLKGRAEPAITRQQMSGYRDAAFAQCRQVFENLTLDQLVRDIDAGGATLTCADHVLDQIRHLHHHIGSMHSQMRRRTGSYPPYVSYNERAAQAAEQAG